MKLLEFKDGLTERLTLLRAGIVFTAQRELAYAGNNWASVLSTTFFTFSILIFVKIIYSNVQSIAGYSYNEMLVYFFIYQLTYYGNYVVTVRNLFDLIPDVNKGNLDMVLVKPVPSLFYLMSRSISIVSIITDAIPPTLAIVFSINWSVIEFSITGIIIGFVVWIFGLIALNSFQILAALPVFWFGESQNILDLANNIAAGGGTMIPREGYSPTLRVLLGTIIPAIIAGGFTTSIVLNKVNPFSLLAWAGAVAIISTFIKNMAWNYALRHYSSASS